MINSGNVVAAAAPLLFASKGLIIMLFEWKKHKEILVLQITVPVEVDSFKINN